jgi:lysophospholipase L1-like esterase
VTGLDVTDSTSGGTVVAYGDSLTDGIGTSNDQQQRWPDVLYDALVTVGDPVRQVVNMGVTGGTLLRDGRSRFDIDVLRQPGVTSVIVFLGVNDLLTDRATYAELIEGFHDVVDRAHAADLRITLATITPLRGPADDPEDLPVNAERDRQLLNALIRVNEFGADAVVDFDAVVRDPEDDSQVAAGYAYFGGVHLNPPGYRALGLTALAARDTF